jgi:hypothetical protein
MFFDLQNEEPVVTPEGLYVDEFKEVWDRAETKDLAHNFFAYIYHTENLNSQYANLDKQEREKECKKDYLKKVPSWPEPKWLKAARTKYRKFQTTPEIRALDAGLELMDKLSTHYRTLDFTDRDDKGKLVNDPNHAMTAIGKLEATVKSMKKLRVEVAKDIDQLSQETYGDKELNMFDKTI